MSHIKVLKWPDPGYLFRKLFNHLISRRSEEKCILILLCSQIKSVFQLNLHPFCSWAFRYVFGIFFFLMFTTNFHNISFLLTARVQKWIHFVLVYSMFLRKQAECIFLFSSYLLFSCFLIIEMTCGSCDSLLTRINSGQSCYSILHLSAFFRLYDSLCDRPQNLSIFQAFICVSRYFHYTPHLSSRELKLKQQCKKQLRDLCIKQTDFSWCIEPKKLLNKEGCVLQKQKSYWQSQQLFLKLSYMQNVLNTVFAGTI